ncbi:hypothetical protein RB195_006751 [Necator americanus]|uniref:Uncharacterized protein n=1 Tax=Necator americanus TaxID=51031 RepID=A0ABR1BVT8_NECAM
MFHGQRISRRLGYTKDITLSAFPAGIQVWTAEQEWSIRIRDGRLWRGGDSVHFFLIAVKKGPGRCGAAQGWRAPVELLVENSAPERLKPCIDG